MSDQPPRSGRPKGAPRRTGMESSRLVRVLPVVFTVTAAAFSGLVVLDLVIGRPAAGDIFVTCLNGVVAVWLWHTASEDTGP